MKVSGWRGWSLALAGVVAVGLSAACGSSSGLAPLGGARAGGTGLGAGMVGRVRRCRGGGLSTGLAGVPG
jgi:hypothetical protein